MFARHSAAVYDFLREARLVETAQLDELYREHAAIGKTLADLVLERGLMAREEFLQRIAAHQSCGFLHELPDHLAGPAVVLLPGQLVRELGILPWRLDGERLDVLVTDPFDLESLDALAFRLDRPVRFYFADPAKIEFKINQHYGRPAGAREESLDVVWQQLIADGVPAAAADEPTVSDLEALARQTPIITFVNLVLRRALQVQASDVHFEPFEQEFKIRYRVDGALYEMTPPPRALALPVISRIKVLANLNIAERRVPQDGRITLRVEEQTADLRVSTLPTQFGESVVLRVLDQSNVRLDITELGMPPEVLAGVQEIVRRPNGIFIVTGPTGSGKTTTLYSALRLINTAELKILTAEDPIEYDIEGLMQLPVNPPIGLTFASALRSFLRQDPDVIMVGEIRDLETAQIAIQAALTGHLVLTTLHTNDAAGAVTRLIDMGVEPFLIASTLEAVLAQRLVRRVCSQCRTEYTPTPAVVRELGLEAAGADGLAFSRGRGCPACNRSGYRGRLGIYEWFPVSDGVRELVTRCAPTLELRERAVAQGMRTLRAAGARAVLNHETSAEEVLRYT